ncbi:class I SAM-dependent methyltransferase [Methanoplanus endosymbiosus]|uniref:SAM-dependent methyltransferase n=1 Tax=Methanoplanus endosymbiosus TaxID=33865 RepID=A0A9E7PL00_9EURY|nr:SAM-dependent methyltransferase [Methanoplanus endosymbiosus]UUX92105.1 SAM-dependent methyltransferase [Methanoplanus endosymbiosus]
MRCRTVKTSELTRISGWEWADRSRRPYVRGDTAYVPVKDGYSSDTEIKERKRYSGPGYQMIGDIAVIHGSRPTESEISEIIGWKNPKGILLLKGFNSEKRIPDTEVLYGECSETCHREAGHIFFIDPSKVMFAMGNRDEKMRIETLVKNSGREERIADMFAGIGYFTIPAGKAGGMVHAMELNPDSYQFLNKNITANGLKNNITADLGDCRDLLRGTYDRVLMGHFDSVNMLKDLIPHIKRGSILHLHSIDSVGDRIREVLNNAGYECEIKEIKVKKYSPGRWHIVQDVTII